MSKVALVTGASGGIGSAVARALSSAGMRLALHYASDSDGALALKAQLQSQGRACRTFRADLLGARAPERLVARVLKAFGRLDVVVNNAGANPGGADFLDMGLKEWEAVLRLNAGAPFFLAREAFKAMKGGGGRIINISSIAVKFGGSARSMHYAAAKAALETWTVGLARQGARHGILVNAIRAGVIDTPFHDKFRKDMGERVALIPLKRMGRPEDVARLALFLAGEGGDYITGQVLPVTGGE